MDSKKTILSSKRSIWFFSAAVIGLGIAGWLLLGGGEDDAAGKAGKVNVLNWSDYIADGSNAAFSAATGIAVQYDTFDANEVLESRLLAGDTGYDVVAPSGGYLGREIAAGVLRRLDKSKLPNLAHLDPAVLAATASFDPGHDYSVPYFWGTTGIGYNQAMIKARMKDAPLDSWDLVFKPEIAAKFADCGIAMLDAPSNILAIALNYLGKDPHSDKPADYAEAEKLLLAVRPFIRYFHSSTYINDMAAGEICLAVGWNGDFNIAQARAREVESDIVINYVIPKEGTLLWVDNLAIPKDAPNGANAEAYINFLLDPKIAAANANAVHFATPNRAALEQGLILPADRDDPGLYPSAPIMSKLFGDRVASQDLDRLRTETWRRVKTGQ